MRKVISIIVFSVMWAMQISAMPAYMKMMKVTQADGTVVAVKMLGDEYRHVLVTEDGYPLTFNTQTKNYEYATIVGSTLVSSGLKATQTGMRSAEAKAFLAGVDKSAVEEALTYNQATYSSSASRMPRKVMKMNDVPTIGSHKALVILVNFSNAKFSMSNPVTYYDEFFHKDGFSRNGAKGCVHEWFVQGSNGNYDPEFDVYGPIDLSENCSYYAGGVNTVMSGLQDTYKMIVEAVNKLDDEIDYSEYDTDGDGICDNVYCIYAGYGQADTGNQSYIWPHSGNLTSIPYTEEGDYSFYADGVKIDRFTVSCEMNGISERPAGIGTFVHEFGHVLGLADHYNNGTGGSNQPGGWDIMARGGYNNDQNTPPLFTAFERYSLGWMEPTELDLTRTDFISVPFLEDNNFAYRVSVPGKDNEYFLIENRQQKGWDKYIPGHGALVWHIEEDQSLWDGNMPNGDNSHQHVDVVEADKGSDSDGRPNDTFPGAANITSFTFKDWNRNEVFGFAFVKEENGEPKILLDGTEYKLDTPTLAVENITGTTARISWNTPTYARTFNVVVKNAGKVVLNKENISSNSLDLKNLEPETEYEVKVTAVNSKLKSDEASMAFTTTKLQVDEDNVTALAATEVTRNSFVANWTKVESAETYEVKLLTRNLTGSTELGTGFDDSTVDDYALPEGWETDCTTSPNAQYGGETAPSFRFSADNSYLLVCCPDSKLQSLRFWHRSNNKKEYVSIEQLVEGEWLTVNDSIGGAAGEEITEHLELNDADAVRIVYHHNIGYFLVDDVYVGYTFNEYTTVKTVTTTETHYAFTNLDETKQYSYKVRAKAGSKYSEESDIVDVNLITDGINLPETWNQEPGTPIYDLQGRKISNQFDGNLPQGIYIVNGVKIVVKYTK